MAMAIWLEKDSFDKTKKKKTTNKQKTQIKQKQNQRWPIVWIQQPLC